MARYEALGGDTSGELTCVFALKRKKTGEG